MLTVFDIEILLSDFSFKNSVGSLDFMASCMLDVDSVEGSLLSKKTNMDFSLPFSTTLCCMIAFEFLL